MKILIAHNFYQSSAPSGEDAVFKSECELLKKNGIDVMTYEKFNDDIVTGLNKLKTAFTAVWSRKTYKELKNLLAKEKPDLAHFHNIWYLITPSAYYACKDAGVPVVQTLHNYRMFCANGLLLRDGKVCEECIGNLPWRGIKYGCYRDSRLYSTPMVLTESIYSIAGTWKDKVDAYIALTEFGKKKFTECGLPGSAIFIKPNFLSDPPEPSYSHEDYVLFLGRLSREKGISVLLDAAKKLDDLAGPLKVKIVGDGPLRKELEEKVKSEKINSIEIVGKKNSGECMTLLKGARFMAMPAICYENFPMAIREAYACGKTVVASRLGAMAELVQDRRTGLLFEAGNSEDLAAKIKWMLENEEACIEMGRNARKVFEEKYTAEKNFEILMKIYKKVIDNSKQGFKGKD
jgi:glycosyltransferase involved in cell wall biosynthesis